MECGRQLLDLNATAYFRQESPVAITWNIALRCGQERRDLIPRERVGPDGAQHVALQLVVGLVRFRKDGAQGSGIRMVTASSQCCNRIDPQLRWTPRFEGDGQEVRPEALFRALLGYGDTYAPHAICAPSIQEHRSKLVGETRVGQLLEAPCAPPDLAESASVEDCPRQPFPFMRRQSSMSSIR